MVGTFAVVKEIVFWVVDLADVFEDDLLVEKYLAVSELPIAEGEHDHGGELHDVESLFVQIVAHDGRLSVEIRELVALDDVQVDQSQKRDGKQDRHNQSIREGDENKVHNCGVPEMQLQIGACVHLDVLLNRHLFGLVAV